MALIEERKGTVVIQLNEAAEKAEFEKE